MSIVSLVIGLVLVITVALGTSAFIETGNGEDYEDDD